LFLRRVTLLKEKITDLITYPFTVPAIRRMDTLDFNSAVTFFVGENGSGKYFT
jgi:predicted ATPase